jgi:hypothetical protein
MAQPVATGYVADDRGSIPGSGKDIFSDSRRPGHCKVHPAFCCTVNTAAGHSTSIQGRAQE